MHNDQDPIIRLFAEQNQGLPSDDFMLQLGKRMEKRRRVRRIFRVFAITACLALSMLCAPWVAQITSTLIDLTATGASSISPLLYVPLTWILVVATAAGCSPVIYLWRTGRW
jgi:H+/Cl- antiporter ClcA